MHYSKTLLVALSTLALAACGGSDGDSSDKDGGGQVVAHGYYTLDYAPVGDYYSLHTTQVPHGVDSGEVKLGNHTVKFSGANDTLAVDGYRHIIIGDEFSAQEGGLLLCKDEDSDEINTNWHAILPANAQALEGDVSLLKGQSFQVYVDCETSDDVRVVFDEDGNITDEDGDVTTAEEVAAMLSEDGLVRDEDGYTVTTRMRLYQSGDRLFIIGLGHDEEDGETELLVLEQLSSEE